MIVKFVLIVALFLFAGAHVNAKSEKQSEVVFKYTLYEVGYDEHKRIGRVAVGKSVTLNGCYRLAAEVGNELDATKWIDMDVLLTVKALLCEPIGEIS
jgi:hypothetical protein